MCDSNHVAWGGLLRERSRAMGNSFARPLCSKNTMPLWRAMSVGRQKHTHLRGRRGRLDWVGGDAHDLALSGSTSGVGSRDSRADGRVSERAAPRRLAVAASAPSLLVCARGARWSGGVRTQPDTAVTATARKCSFVIRNRAAAGRGQWGTHSSSRCFSECTGEPRNALRKTRLRVRREGLRLVQEMPQNTTHPGRRRATTNGRDGRCQPSIHAPSTLFTPIPKATVAQMTWQRPADHARCASCGHHTHEMKHPRKHKSIRQTQ